MIARIGIAAAVLLPFALVALRGRWGLLRRNAGLVVLYGLLAVAGAQFCYFSAVQYMQVGPALLIEYTAPAAVVVWMWLRHGQRPGLLTLMGAGLAALGLVLVLDLLSGADLSVPGVLWSLGAMVGCAPTTSSSATTRPASRRSSWPPPAWSSGAVVVALLGIVGLFPMTHVDHRRARTPGTSFSWWQPLVALGVVTAALSYVTGVAAGRLLGSRLASFVALTEVVAGCPVGLAAAGRAPAVHPARRAAC